MKGIGFLLGVIIIGTFGRNAFPYDDNIFYLGEATCWLLLAMYIFHTSERYVKITSLFMCVCYSFNLVVEIFGAPTEFSFIKYLVLTINFLICTFLAIKLRLKENNTTFSFRKLKLTKCN